MKYIMRYPSRIQFFRTHTFTFSIYIWVNLMIRMIIDIIYISRYSTDIYWYISGFHLRQHPSQCIPVMCRSRLDLRYDVSQRFESRLRRGSVRPAPAFCSPTLCAPAPVQPRLCNSIGCALLRHAGRPPSDDHGGRGPSAVPGWPRPVAEVTCRVPAHPWWPFGCWWPLFVAQCQYQCADGLLQSDDKTSLTNQRWWYVCRVVWCDVVSCDAGVVEVWRDVLRCGVMWYGVACCAVAWCSGLWCIVVWCAA